MRRPNIGVFTMVVAALVHPTCAAAQALAPLDTMIDAGDHRLHFVVHRGTAPVTIVLESGGGATVQDWTGLDSALADRTGATVVAYDRAGFGRSELGPTDLEPMTQVEHLDAALASLGVPEARLLVGASYGGLMALLHARMLPEKVVALVLLDPMNPGFVEATGDFVHGTVQSFPDPAHDWQRASMRLVRTFRGVLWETRLALMEVRVPSLIVTAGEPWWGRDDVVHAWRASHETMSAQLAGELVVAHGARHRIATERQDVVLEAVQAAMERAGY